MKVSARVSGDGMAQAEARVADIRRRAIERLQRRRAEERAAPRRADAPDLQPIYPRGYR